MKNKLTPQAPGRTPSQGLRQIFEALSTSPNRFPKNVLVQAVVIPELELGHIERQIFLADFVIGADHPALNQAPKAFNGVGVDRTANIFTTRMVNNFVREVVSKVLVAYPLVRADQADLGRNAFADEAGECIGADILDHAGDNATLATNSADHNSLTGTDAASPTAAAAFVLMPVLGFAADERLIDFNNAHQLLKAFVSHPSADTVAHAPRGFVGAGPDHAMDLKGADTLLAGQDHVDDAEPDPERVFGVLEDGPGDHRKAVIGAGRRTGITEPREGYGAVFFDLSIPAAGARNPVRPAARGQVSLTGVIVGKRRFPLADGHLMYAFTGLFHRPNPSQFLKQNIGGLT